MKKDTIIALLKKQNELQTDLNMIEFSLHHINVWSSKYNTVSNKREEIYEQIRQIKKQIYTLENEKR